MHGNKATRISFKQGLHDNLYIDHSPGNAPVRNPRNPKYPVTAGKKEYCKAFFIVNIRPQRINQVINIPGTGNLFLMAGFDFVRVRNFNFSNNLFK